MGKIEIWLLADHLHWMTSISGIVSSPRTVFRHLIQLILSHLTYGISTTRVHLKFFLVIWSPFLHCRHIRPRFSKERFLIFYPFFLTQFWIKFTIPSKNQLVERRRLPDFSLCLSMCRNPPKSLPSIGTLFFCFQSHKLFLTIKTSIYPNLFFSLGLITVVF